MFAYTVQVSLDAGFDGVLDFKAKISDLLDYYARAFGVRRATAYDPFWMIIWEDAAERIIVESRRIPMSEMSRDELSRAEAIGSEQG